jgi:hypothetical protein
MKQSLFVLNLLLSSSAAISVNRYNTGEGFPANDIDGEPMDPEDIERDKTFQSMAESQKYHEAISDLA